MYIKAFAKINVALNVLNVRKDGYHDLDMIVLPLELHDAIEVEIMPNASDTYITCDEVSLSGGKYNIVQTAINKARDKYHFKNNFDIIIHKEIPISAGLGGGSSNAASVLNAIFHLLKIQPSYEDIIDLAKSVGSDVPFCMFNVPSRVKGVGDILEPISLKTKYSVLIVKPEQGLSTKEVYEMSNKKAVENCDIDRVVDALALGDEKALAASAKNSLENASISMLPEIQTIKDNLRSDGLDIVLMSGSGSSVFALSTDHHKLSKLVKKYEKLGYDVVLTKIK